MLNDDVFGLDISVDDPIAVEVGDGLEEMGQDKKEFGLRKVSAFLDESEKVVA